MKYLDLFTNTPHAVNCSQFALGCDHYGLKVPEEEAFRIMDAFYEQGGTLFDTAHIYGQLEDGGVSLSEQTVGKWVAKNRLHGKVVISDKGAHPNRNDKKIGRIDEKNIQLDLFSSLEALQSDYVDIWFLHRDNPEMPVGEIVDIVSSFADKGYIKHLGVSNWPVSRIAEAVAYAQKHGRHPFDISQIQWSLAISTPASWEDATIVCMDDAQLPWYEANQFPVMAFSPQGRGIFSKAIERGTESVDEKTRKRFLLEQNMGRIERCCKLCDRDGINPAGICLAYLTSAPFPTIPVLGFSSHTQVKDSLQFSNLTISEDDRAYLVQG